MRWRGYLFESRAPERRSTGGLAKGGESTCDVAKSYHVSVSTISRLSS